MLELGSCGHAIARVICLITILTHAMVAGAVLLQGTSRRASNSMAHSCRRTMGTFIASRNRNCLYTGAASR
jgi:hypothetical protein